MSEQKLEAYFFTTIFISVLVLVGILFYPFIGSLALALVLAILVAPVYRALVARTNRPGLTAALVVLIVTLAVILPAAGLTALLVDEAMGIRESLMAFDISNVPALFHGLSDKIHAVVPATESINIASTVQSVTQYAGLVAAGIFTGTMSALFSFIIVIIALFYFLKDGERFLKEIIKLSPLSDDEDVQIIRKLERVTHSLIRGTLVVALLQGVLMGTGFLMFGVPNPVLWGAVAAVGALLPNIGTAIVSVPAILYLIYIGHIPQAIGFIGWAVLVVGLIDNVVGSRLIGNGARIHPLFILLSVLGGIALFGIAGFLLGPLIFGLLVALAEIYKVKVREIHERS